MVTVSPSSVIFSPSPTLKFKLIKIRSPPPRLLPLLPPWPPPQPFFSDGDGDAPPPFLLPISVFGRDPLPRPTAHIDHVSLLDSETSFSSFDDDGAGDASAKAAPSFPELEAVVERSIVALDGTSFPKLNWSAPKDVAWTYMTMAIVISSPSTPIYSAPPKTSPPPSLTALSPSQPLLHLSAATTSMSLSALPPPTLARSSPPSKPPPPSLPSSMPLNRRASSPRSITRPRSAPEFVDGTLLDLRRWHPPPSPS